jgi:hypothetical protein
LPSSSLDLDDDLDDDDDICGALITTLHGDEIYAADRLTSFQLSTATVPVESWHSQSMHQSIEFHTN